MVCGETALAFLNRNRLLYLDMLEPIRRGTAELLYTGDDGVLLYDRLAEAHMLGADTPQALERMLPLMEGCTILTGHQLWYKDRLAARFGLTCEQICYQAAWLEETPPRPPALRRGAAAAGPVLGPLGLRPLQPRLRRGGIYGGSHGPGDAGGLCGRNPRRLCRVPH